jgi:hypothetical protein
MEELAGLEDADGDSGLDNVWAGTEKRSERAVMHDFCNAAMDGSMDCVRHHQSVGYIVHAQ